MIAAGSIYAGAATGADGDENAFLIGGQYFERHQVGAATNFGFQNTATGLTIVTDAADNEGCEISQGILASSPFAFTVGTSPAFFMRAKLTVNTLAKFDVVQMGFRTIGAYEKPALTPAGYLAAYSGATNHKSTIGVYDTSGGIQIANTTDGTDAATDTTDTIVTGTDTQFQVLVDGDGAATFQHDIATAGTLAAPTATVAKSFDAADVVVPFLFCLRGAATGGTVELLEWECGLQ